METLIRGPVLQRLIGVCAVCLCPTIRTLVLYGLTKDHNTWSIELVLNNVANFRKILIKKSGHRWCDVRTDARTDRRMYGQTDRGNT